MQYKMNYSKGGDYYSVRLEITRKKLQSASVSVYDSPEQFTTRSSKEFRRVQELQTSRQDSCLCARRSRKKPGKLLDRENLPLPAEGGPIV
jgi:hypothetical protein